MNEDLIVALVVSNIAVSLVALFVSFNDRRMFMECGIRGEKNLVLVCESIREAVQRMGKHTHELVETADEISLTLPSSSICQFSRIDKVVNQ